MRHDFVYFVGTCDDAGEREHAVGPVMDVGFARTLCVVIIEIEINGSPSDCGFCRLMNTITVVIVPHSTANQSDVLASAEINTAACFLRSAERTG